MNVKPSPRRVSIMPRRCGNSALTSNGFALTISQTGLCQDAVVIQHQQAMTLLNSAREFTLPLSQPVNIYIYRYPWMIRELFTAFLFHPDHDFDYLWFI